MLRFLIYVIAASLAIHGGAARGQSYPERTVRLVAAYPPGGGVDGLSRILARKLQDVWGQTVVVENRPGAWGNIGTAVAVKSKPDGYTLAIVPQGVTTVHPHMFDNVGFDIQKDVAPVMRLTEQSFILVANPEVPIRTLKSCGKSCSIEARGSDVWNVGSRSANRRRILQTQHQDGSASRAV